MDMLVIILFFLFGLLGGSFFYTVGLRIPKGMALTNEWSICPSCHHSLHLPAFLLRAIPFGGCHHCRIKTTVLYPFITFVTAFLFVLCYMIFGFQRELMMALCLLALLMIIFVSDSMYMLIPNKVLLFLLPLFLICRMVQPLDPWWDSLLGAFLGCVIIFIIMLVSHGGMGAGDMKLFGLLGLVLGVKKVFLAFFLSCLIGAIIGMILLVLRFIDRKQPIPFGPYIVIATIITYFYGDHIIQLFF